ncbi:MAG: hypothetical protein KDB27_19675, partial [Planctomycetales bacterium]|nr:hypothetical protein [Planctomycetales bacterium]
ETMKRAIEIDSGIGLLPEPTVSREVSFGTLAAIPLVGETSLVRPLGIVWRRGKEQTEATERFVEFLLEQPRIRTPNSGSIPDLESVPVHDAASSIKKTTPAEA